MKESIRPDQDIARENKSKKKILIQGIDDRLSLTLWHELRHEYTSDSFRRQK